MPNTLEKICSDKRDHVANCKRQTPLSTLEQQVNSATPPRGFYNALKNALAEKRYGLICEIKKASPSKGLIREDFNPPVLAKAYEDGGATCLSVLTDVSYFQGRDDFLISARNAVSLPCLRKDFMIDTYQVTEARALGADCILIIMAALEDSLAQELEDAAFHYGMDVLIEVHNADELERAHKLKSPMIGINNRNLKTFETTLQTTIDLTPHVEKNRMVIGESGLFTPEDLALLKTAGVNSFLIGESLMRQDNVSAATRHLLEGTI
ncbi:MAG: indole-3-glycerol-phosphate synthase [Kordiimonas sp.]|nr:indole-3-glycerol-phosphate synthase [Kordiimonas sp.]